MNTEYPTTLWPLLLYAVLVVLVAAGMLIISHFIGQRHKENETDEAYESGIVSTGNARIRFSAHFYIVAMFFVIFDLEAVFIFSWAVAFKELGLDRLYRCGCVYRNFNSCIYL